MTLTIISTDTIADGTAHTLLIVGDDLYVVSGAILASTGGIGVNVLASDTSTVIDGTLIGGLRAYSSGQGNSRLVVGSTGVVQSFRPASSDAGILSYGANSSVINHGLINVPEAIGIFMGGANGEVQNSGSISGTTGVQIASGSTSTSLVNTGTIMGSGQFDDTQDQFEGRGIFVQGGNTQIENGATGVIGSTAVNGTGILAASTSNGLVIENLGLITASQGHGIDFSAMNLGATGGRVTNFNTISGHGNSFIGSQIVDAVVNRGTMIGTVDMGLGNDTLDNRGGIVEGDVILGDGTDTLDNRGGVVNGTVTGGLGNDKFRGNALAADTFDGGDGAGDTLDFRGGPAAVVALDGSEENAGAALGDSYVSIEHVYGSTLGDVIVGSSAVNSLRGEGGADVMDAAAGSDLLRGGAGIDTLTGGLGNDKFIFEALRETGDVITDFGTVAGNDDQILIRAAAFGGGLVAGAVAAGIFVSRGDNLAQDANDRFVFRTTDHSLWFDADGSGAGAAIMVADLQAGVTLTAADLLLS